MPARSIRSIGRSPAGRGRRHRTGPVASCSRRSSIWRRCRCCGGGIEPRWIGAGAAALGLLALPFALFGWRWTPLILLLLSGPLAAAAGRLAAVRLTASHRPARLHAIRAAAAAGALLLLGADLSAARGWGCWLLGFVALGAMAALTRERRIWGEGDAPLWLASLDGMIWLFAIGALSGSWLGAIALVTAYATGSFAFVQDRILRQMAAERV